MTQESISQRYRGVLCRCCKQNIPVPAFVVIREAKRNEQGQDNEPEPSGYVFALRCRACEREYLYQSSDIMDFQGTPRPRSFRGGSAQQPAPRVSKVVGA